MDTFTRAYIECALWSSMDNTGGEPLDANFSIADLAPATLKTMTEECADFRELSGDKLAGIDDGRAGHDFWLTRNGHGAGFWARGLGKLGDDLSRDAKSYGSADLYVGDDGLIYQG